MREGAAPRPADPADPNEHFALALDYLSDPEGHQIELTTYRG